MRFTCIHTIFGVLRAIIVVFYEPNAMHAYACLCDGDICTYQQKYTRVHTYCGSRALLCSKSTYNYIHTYIRAYIHTYIHTYMQTALEWLRRFVHSYVLEHIHTYIHTYIHTCRARRNGFSVRNRNEINKCIGHYAGEYHAMYVSICIYIYIYMYTSAPGGVSARA